MSSTKFLFQVVLATMAVFACSVEPEIGETEGENPEKARKVASGGETCQPIRGEAYLVLTDDMVGTDLNALAEELGAKSAELLFPDEDGRFAAKHHAAGLDKWVRVLYDEEIDPVDASESFRAHRGIEAVDLPMPIKQHRLNYFNDPYAYYQWHYYNDGSSYGTGFKAGSDINVLPVWEEFTAGSPDVIVAVIDGGVDLSHVDLAGVCLPAGENGSANFVGDDRYNIIPDDHGTHVAGTIAAINNNGKGVCGVAGGKDGTGGVKIMSCAIFQGTTNGNTSAALVWAADHGAVIANNSWGSSFDNEEQARSGHYEFIASTNSATKKAIDYFIDTAGMDENGNQTGPMKGGVVFFSSGNEGWPYGVPAVYDRVIAVGAFGHNGRVADYSNYGDWVDILAPGGSDSDNSKEWILSLVTGNQYAFMGGTSMASPHASGVAALLVSYFGGPGFTNEELVERMLLTAPLNAINTGNHPVGGGKIDAYKAFTYEGRGEVSITTDYAGEQADGAFVFHSHEKKDIRYSITGNPEGRLSVTFESLADFITADCTGTEAIVHVNAPAAKAGVYNCKITLGKDTPFAASQSFKVKVLENQAPVVTGKIADQVIDANSGNVTIDLSACFSDPDGEPLSYLCAESAGVVTSTISSNTLTLKPSAYGESSITITASDAKKASVKLSFRVIVRDTSKAVDIYPNPVSDRLYVRPSAAGNVSITLSGQNGAVVFEETVTADVFAPATVDVRSLKAGIYKAKVTVGDNSMEQTLMKL